MMKTRKATEVHRKAKRSKRMKGMIPFHLYPSFDELITDIDTNLVGEMENSSKHNWNIGAKDILPHIMWKYTSGDVDASKDWQEKGKYESSILYLSLCNKDVIKKHVGFPITTGLLHPWLEVKKVVLKEQGWDYLLQGDLRRGAFSLFILLLRRVKNHPNSLSMH